MKHIVRNTGPRMAALAAGASIAVLGALASSVSPSASAATPEESIQVMLERETSGIAGRAEIAVGALDPRFNVAACARVEPFLPPGTRPWGRINIGLRCLRENGTPGGPTAFLPVTVRVFGTGLAAAKSLTAGSTPSESEVEPIESELSKEPGTPVTDLKQVEGRVLSRSIYPGQILRVEYFRAAPAVAQGDQVKLVATGPGFTITTDGEALAQALEGQSVRVRTDTGRVVSGTAKSGRVVELRY